MVHHSIGRVVIIILYVGFFLSASVDAQALAPAETCPSGFTFTPCVESFEFGEQTGYGFYCSLFLTAPWDAQCNIYEQCSVCKCSCNNPVSNAGGCGPQAPYDPCVPNNSSQALAPAGSIDFAVMVVQMRVRVVQNATNQFLSSTTSQDIKQFFLTQTLEACGATDCQLTMSKLTMTVADNPVRDADGTAWLFDVTLDIRMLNNARTMLVKQSFRLTSSVLQAKLLEQDPPLGFFINTYNIIYRADTTRPSVCGDSVLIASEECDDGNTANGDGCSATCILETGYMCYGARRETVGARGKMTAWTTDTSGKKTLSILATAEGCLKDDIMLQDSREWAPAQWIPTYSTNSPAVTLDMLPGVGFYARRFCERTFPAAVFYEFNNSCIPTGRDECSRGESDCDRNAYCTEPADGVGYECECDEKYFVSGLHGRLCALDGVEVQLTLGGPIGLDATVGSASFDAGLALITRARLTLMSRLLLSNFSHGAYLNDLSSEELLLEGVRRYPIALKQNTVTEPGPMFNRAVWTIVLRAPDMHLNMTNMAIAGNMFDHIQLWPSMFYELDGNNQPVLLVNSVGQCSNDRRRTCSAADATCLAGAVCDEVSPDFLMTKLTGGGSAAPLLVASSGMDVMSVDYDISQTAFKIRMRYNNVVPGVIDTVFVSHMGVGQDPFFLSTFNSDEFPCLPLGTGIFQDQRDNSGVCIEGILPYFPYEIYGHGGCMV